VRCIYCQWRSQSKLLEGPVFERATVFVLDTASRSTKWQDMGGGPWLRLYRSPPIIAFVRRSRCSPGCAQIAERAYGTNSRALATEKRHAAHTRLQITTPRAEKRSYAKAAAKCKRTTSPVSTAHTSWREKPGFGAQLEVRPNSGSNNRSGIPTTRSTARRRWRSDCSKNNNREKVWRSAVELFLANNLGACLLCHSAISVVFGLPVSQLRGPGKETYLCLFSDFFFLMTERVTTQCLFQY